MQTCMKHSSNRRAVCNSRTSKVRLHETVSNYRGGKKMTQRHFDSIKYVSCTACWYSGVDFKYKRPKPVKRFPVYFSDNDNCHSKGLKWSETKMTRLVEEISPPQFVKLTLELQFMSSDITYGIVAKDCVIIGKSKQKQQQKMAAS